MTGPLPSVHKGDHGWVIALVFFQMLPATMVAPAIRPLFASRAGAPESVMHAFMSVNMVGAAIAAGAIAYHGGARKLAVRGLAVLLALDAALLLAVSLPFSVGIVLALRALEGAAHVAAASLMMGAVAVHARTTGASNFVAAGGMAIVFAIALGSVFGSIGLSFGPQMPFWVGAAMLVAVSVWCATSQGRSFFELAQGNTPARPATAIRALGRSLWVPASAALMSRFVIGCLVVSFALFAHKRHALGDRTIGTLFSCLTLSFAVSMGLAAALAKKIPRACVLGSGAALLSVGLAVLGVAPTEVLAPLMVGLGIASGFVFASILAYAAEVQDVDKSGAMALLNGAGCLGMLLGPMAGGIACAVFRTETDPVRGYRAAFLVAAAAASAWLIGSMAWLTRRGRSERALGRSVRAAMEMDG